MTRRFVIKQRISLAKYSEGWTDCYLLMTALTKGDFEQMSNIEDLSNEEAESFINELLATHFVSGKVRVTSDDGVETLADAELDDIKEFPRVMRFGIFEDLGMGGAQYRNPKV